MYRAYRNLCRFVMLLGGVGIFLMMANVTLDVFLKFVWNLPIQGTVEISSYYYMVSIVMLPMALVELDDEHVSVDLLFPHYPIWLQQTCLVLACGAAVGILSVMAWRTGLDAIRAFNVGEVVMGSREIIVWPARCMLPLGFGLTAVAAAIRMVMAVMGKPVTKQQSKAAYNE
ncbi:MAG: TRAP transporter small permease [Alphaproteobacteria bacterium]